VLLEFAAAFQAKGGRVFLCGVNPEHDRVIERLGMRNILPREQVFLRDVPVFQALHAASERALAGLPLDAPLSAGWRSYCQGRTSGS
jgi:hypothetical protein